MAHTPNSRARSEYGQEWLSMVPVFPLVSAVLLPGHVLSLQVTIDRSVEMLRTLPADQPLIGAFFQSRGNRDDPRPEDLARVGVLALVVQKLPVAEGRFQLFLQGRQRIRAEEFVRGEHCIEARVVPLLPI